MFSNVVEEQSYRDRTQIFKDRIHAGVLLSRKFKGYMGKKDAILLAVPSGGVPVAYAMGKELHILFDLAVVRKIQIPWNPEAGFGAVTWDGEAILNSLLVEQLGLTEELIDEAISKTKEIVKERIKNFRGERLIPDLRDKTVILVDDGLASGFTMLAAVRSIRKENTGKIVIAVPTASQRAIRKLAPEVDELVCLNVRSGAFFAVADAYVRWYDLSDEEVLEFLKEAWKK